jgi:hypothetical protein
MPLRPGGQGFALFAYDLRASLSALAGLGWTDGRNVRIDFRWPGGDINRMRAIAQEMVGLQPGLKQARVGT